MWWSSLVLNPRSSTNPQQQRLFHRADNIPPDGVVIPFNYRFEHAEDIPPDATIHYLNEIEDPWETPENRFASRDPKPPPPTPEELKQQEENKRRKEKEAKRRREEEAEENRVFIYTWMGFKGDRELQ